MTKEPDWAAEGLLDGLEGEDLDARIALLRDLHADGVPLDELRKAAAEQRLMFLPVERALGEELRYSPRQIAEATGLDFDFLTRAVAGARPAGATRTTRSPTASATSRLLAA